MRALHELIHEAAVRQGSGASRRGVLAGGTLALAAAAAQAPVAALSQSAEASRRNDIDLLNYALTLEHLEYAFYEEGIKKFGRVVEFIEDVEDHERIHVETLTKVIRGLGGEPVGEGCYDFGFTTKQKFLATAQVLEDTGVMAYDGAIALIDAPELRTAGATIATVEARHAAYLNGLVQATPFPAAFDTPLSPDEVVAAVTPFIDAEGAAGAVATPEG